MATPKSDQKEEYIRLKEFKEKKVELPYKTELSLKPLIRKIREKDSENQINLILLEKLEEIEQKISRLDSKSNSIQGYLTESLMQNLFPSLFFKGQMGFIREVFMGEFIYESPALKNLMNAGNWMAKVQKFEDHRISKIIFMSVAKILETFYGVDIEHPTSQILSLRNTEDHLDRYLKIDIISDYVDVVALKPPRNLREQEIRHLMNNLDDEDLVKRLIPPENFRFEGFIIGYLTDITEVQVLSHLKDSLVDINLQKDHRQVIMFLQSQARALLGSPDIYLGSVQNVHGEIEDRVCWSLLTAKVGAKQDELEGDVCSCRMDDLDKAEQTYVAALNGNEVIISDLRELREKTIVEDLLIEKGIRSLLLLPLRNPSGHVCALFELGSTQPNQFNWITVRKLRDFVGLFELGMNRGMQEKMNEISRVMQQQFTSIHPSVQWKFTERTSQYIARISLGDESPELDPIVFEEVYPLYGQVDIIGSSDLRNRFIKADLVDNLRRVLRLIDRVLKDVDFHLLKIYRSRAQDVLGHLLKDELLSRDESEIIELLTRDIHPLLRMLAGQYQKFPHKKMEEYFRYLDHDLDVVYRERKMYDQSVNELNQAISRNLERADSKMQTILPHYFEKYKTDGVEYNIYLGQSILQKEKFSHFHLKDFRLWQLIHMCEVVDLVRSKSATLDIQLSTAQLIFVYSSPLSINFRMDEKRFDVDGAYNVRYEILKKRIDKARIRETGERITQEGKIAIVWLNEKDRVEYLEYVDHLIEEGLLEENVEEFELEKVQGADGLNAIRVTVKQESSEAKAPKTETRELEMA